MVPALAVQYIAPVLIDMQQDFMGLKSLGEVSTRFTTDLTFIQVAGKNLVGNTCCIELMNSTNYTSNTELNTLRYLLLILTAGLSTVC